MGICEASFPRELYPGDEKIFIGIDLKLIKLNDSKNIKNTVWKYIERCIKKRNQEGKRTSIYKEPQEVLPLYRCKDKTFNNYLKWYDWQMQEKLGWRLIAFIENQSKDNPLKAKELLKKIRNKSKKPQVGIFDPKSNKVFVEGEDKVEKGIKLIYQAIHRKPYHPKDIAPLLDEYNCPQHGLSCPESCKYYKDWLSRFDRLMPPD